MGFFGVFWPLTVNIGGCLRHDRVLPALDDNSLIEGPETTTQVKRPLPAINRLNKTVNVSPKKTNIRQKLNICLLLCGPHQDLARWLVRLAVGLMLHSPGLNKTQSMTVRRDQTISEPGSELLKLLRRALLPSFTVW